MSQRWSFAGTLTGILAMLLLAGLLWTMVQSPAQGTAGSDEMIEVISDPITHIALMTTDLDQACAGRATLDGEPGEVVVRATPDMPHDLRGKEVLIYHSELWGGWRLMSTDIGVLSPSLRR
jgi:hypothetical protein